MIVEIQSWHCDNERSMHRNWTKVILCGQQTRMYLKLEGPRWIIASKYNAQTRELFIDCYSLPSTQGLVVYVDSTCVN